MCIILTLWGITQCNLDPLAPFLQCYVPPSPIRVAIEIRHPAYTLGGPFPPSPYKVCPQTTVTGSLHKQLLQGSSSNNPPKVSLRTTLTEFIHEPPVQGQVARTLADLW